MQGGMAFKLNRTTAQSSSEQIEAYYARAILSGKLAPGARLPSNKELSTQWKTSSLAVHRALGNLVTKGLLERRQQRGTFVRDLSKAAMIAILMGPNLVWSGATFFRVLADALTKELEALHFSCRVYDDLTDRVKKLGEEAPTLKHFLLDRQVFDFKGYIHIGTATISPPCFNDLSPHVTHLDSKRGMDVIIDMDHFLSSSLEELAALGYRRFLYLRPLWLEDKRKKRVPQPEALFSTAKALGLPKPDLWDLFLEAQGADMEQSAFERLCDALKQGRLTEKTKEEPEVILVSDDAIARSLVMALLHFGYRIPESVRICVCASQEGEVFYGVPVYRYQFSIRELSTKMVTLLRSRMVRQEEPPLPLKVCGTFRQPPC